MLSRVWVHGLIAAAIGGMASTLDSGLTLLVAAPKEFNLSDGLKKTLFTLLVLGCLNGAKLAFAYLKAAPDPWAGDERRNGGDSLSILPAVKNMTPDGRAPVQKEN
jgi:hypothetical protein